MKTKRRLIAVGLICSLIVLIFGGGRSSTTVYADTVEHTHIWADKYDSSNHWKYCTVCGTVKDKEAHTFTDHWYLGYKSCNSGNYSRRICNCGYSYIYHKPHSGTHITKSHTYYERVHATTCSSCGTWLKTEACKNANGVINCKNPGKCLTCGGTWPAGRHFINNGTCSACGKTFYKLSEPQVSYNNDFTHVYIKYIFYPVNSSVIPIDTQTNYSPYTNGGMSHHGNVVKNSDGTYTINLDVTISSKNEKISVGWIYDNVAVNGVTCFVYTNNITVWRDHQAPVQNDVIQKDQASANGWATIKQLTLSGTEDFSDIVYLTVSDKATGEKYVTNAAVPVTSGKYSYTCTPSIEGDANGRTYVVAAKDQIGNTSTKEFVVSKTDGSHPQLKSGTSLTYTDWSTSKNISLNFFDFGSGGVQASLDNQTDYKPLTKSGEYYVWNHSFGNQVGTTEHTIYVRDALGNAGLYKLTVGNTDSTNYKITYNLDGGSMSGQPTSYNVESSTFTLPTPTKTGHIFTGWTGSNGTTPQKTVAVNKGTRGNLSYMANWAPVSWTVKYDANGGTGTMADSKHVYESGSKLNQNQFSKTGYTFNGWQASRVRNGKTEWLCANTDNSWIDGNEWYEKDKIPSNRKIFYFYDCQIMQISTYIDGDVITMHALWNVNTYTNQIGHWAEGFKYREGNNDNKNALRLKDTSFSASYKSNIVMDSAKAVKIPNGYYLRGLGTPEVDGTFKAYSIGLKLIQKPASMRFEYYYDPISYSITYNFNGGINNSSNPSTYTVLYGVNLKAPTRAGYTFAGWYDENGNKVTGINEGCNASFSSAADLYAKLAARTTGNRVLTAHWSYNPVSVKVPQILIGDYTGKSQFRVKCDDFKIGSIKVAVPDSFLYKQTGKADVTATITVKSGSNIITPSNKVCVYNIATKNGLTAGCWSGSFNIGLTLTKE